MFLHSCSLESHFLLRFFFSSKNQKSTADVLGIETLDTGFVFVVRGVVNHHVLESRQFALQAPILWALPALLSPNQSCTATAYSTRKTLFVCF